MGSIPPLSGNNWVGKGGGAEIEPMIYTILRGEGVGSWRGKGTELGSMIYTILRVERTEGGAQIEGWGKDSRLEDILSNRLG